MRYWPQAVVLISIFCHLLSDAHRFRNSDYTPIIGSIIWAVSFIFVLWCGGFF